jgi:hypothetical protein
MSDSGNYRVVPLGDKFAVDDTRKLRDSLVRGWRKGATHLIWRGTLTEAQELCEQLNKGTKTAKVELSKTQRIHYANIKRKTGTIPPTPTFVRCATCGTMSRLAKHC